MARATIAVHGAAGAIARASKDANKEQCYRQALSEVICCAQGMLAGHHALDVLSEARPPLEECRLFNASGGSLLTHHGQHEPDACAMDGATRAAVAGVARVLNPLLAARVAPGNRPHLLLIGARPVAAAQGLERGKNHFFSAAPRRAQPQRTTDCDPMLLDYDGDRRAPGDKFATVGAAACERKGDRAAATSGGGMTNKRAARSGDPALPAAGCHASRAVAISCTASGGTIAVDTLGKRAQPFNCNGMYRAYGMAGAASVMAIYREEL